MDKSHRTIFKSIAITLICLLLLTACGREKETNSGQSSQPRTEGQSAQPQNEGSLSLSENSAKGMELQVERSSFYDVSSELKGGYFRGMQYYQGEPVQLWRTAPYKKDDGKSYVSVYMYRQDGTREFCAEGEVGGTEQNIFFRDADGYYAKVYSDIVNNEIAIIRLDNQGNEQYKLPVGNVYCACELPDGRQAMLIYEGTNARDFDIALLDGEGEVTVLKLSEHFDANTQIGVSEDGLLMLAGDYLYRVNLSDGSLEPLYSFRQFSYDLSTGTQGVKAFRMQPDGGIELLKAARADGGNGVVETLKIVELGTERQEVVLRSCMIESQPWLKEKIWKFNSTNRDYYITIQSPEKWDDMDAYITATGVELATGKGPDLLVGNELVEAPGSLIEKGILLDLAPLMEQAGIKEEDYYPLAFDKWRTESAIYSFTYQCSIAERAISVDVLGDLRNPGIEELMDAMLAYPEKAVYNDSSNYPAAGVLAELLQGSETLFGMMDWEKGTCDFDGELFRKLLEVSKRYGYDERNNYPAIANSIARIIMSKSAIYELKTEENLKKEGYVPLGILFDDGFHPWSRTINSISINANGSNKEGAWEFVKFLMSDEAQEDEDEVFFMPVKRSAFWKLVENAKPDDYKKYSFTGPLEERAKEVEAFIENARALPYRTEPILDIILEEAQDYFDGRKDISQVVQVIENRVNLYLQEQVR